MLGLDFRTSCCRTVEIKGGRSFSSDLHGELFKGALNGLYTGFTI